jgi:hypothetical protein
MHAMPAVLVGERRHAASIPDQQTGRYSYPYKAGGPYSRPFRSNLSTAMAMQLLRSRSAPLLRVAQQTRNSTGATFPNGA